MKKMPGMAYKNLYYAGYEQSDWLLKNVQPIMIQHSVLLR